MMAKISFLEVLPATYASQVANTSLEQSDRFIVFAMIVGCILYIPYEADKVVFGLARPVQSLVSAIVYYC